MPLACVFGIPIRPVGLVEETGRRHDVEHFIRMTVATSDGRSEPLGDLSGAWNEVPESHVGIIQPGGDELRPFTPSRP